MVTLDDVRAAAVRIRGVAVRTPLLDVGPLALKCENLQPMGAFKVRGACNMIAQLSPAARSAGVITYSSGNHGQAVALVAQRFGIPAVVVMPETAPPIKVEGVRRYGAEVIVAGTTTLHRKARAEQELARRGLTMVPPFDDPWVIAGQGTVGLEIVEDRPMPDVVLTGVGGGGLISGIAVAVKSRNPNARVIGVEPEGSDALRQGLEAGHPVPVTPHTAADALTGPFVGGNCLEICRELGVESVLVSEEELFEAFRWLYARTKLACELGGAAGTAALLSGKVRVRAGETVVAVVSGGNIDLTRFASLVGACG